MFDSSIDIDGGEVLERDDFIFANVIPTD